jgi:glycopeptide antibiotics resistance protein
LPERRVPGRWVYALALGSLLGLLALRLTPFRFVFDGRVPLERISLAPTSLRDVPLNVLLIAPLAFALAGILSRRGLAWGHIARRVIGYGLLLSVALEAAQLFMPARVPSVADVAANAAGLALGLWVYRAWTVGFAAAVAAAATPRNLALVSAFYLAAVALLLAALFNGARLAPWDNAYPLLLGNEADGERPWKGQVDVLALFDRALDPVEAAAALEGEMPPGAFARYRLTGPGPYMDEMNRLPALAWAGPAGPGTDGQVGPGAWLAARPPAGWSSAVAETSDFSVVLVFTPENAEQRGPARLMTVSGDKSHRNLTIGQAGPDLVIRLRTAVSGDNGRKPEVVLPGGMAAAPQSLVVTYDAPRLVVYPAGAAAQGLSFAPGVAFFAGFMTSPEWVIALGGHPRRYDWLFVGVVVAPVLLAAAIIAWARRTTAAS